jgi:hypothetical protein
VVLDGQLAQGGRYDEWISQEVLQATELEVVAARNGQTRVESGVG